MGLRGGDVGLNDAERIWMNLKYTLIISVLTHRNKRYAPVTTRIMSSISAR